LDLQVYVLNHFHKYLSAETVFYKGDSTSFVTYARSLGYPGYFYGVAIILIMQKKFFTDPDSNKKQNIEEKEEVENVDTFTNS
jgi:hypothetical protein